MCCHLFEVKTFRFRASPPAGISKHPAVRPLSSFDWGVGTGDNKWQILLLQPLGSISTLTGSASTKLVRTKLEKKLGADDCQPLFSLKVWYPASLCTKTNLLKLYISLLLLSVSQRHFLGTKTSFCSATSSVSELENEWVLSSVDSGCHTCARRGTSIRAVLSPLPNANSGRLETVLPCLGVLQNSSSSINGRLVSKLTPFFGSPSPLSVSNFGGSSPTAQGNSWPFN